jgi:hypothetical protein
MTDRWEPGSREDLHICPAGGLRREFGRLAQAQNQCMGLGFAAGQAGVGGGEAAVAEACAGDSKPLITSADASVPGAP